MKPLLTITAVLVASFLWAQDIQTTADYELPESTRFMIEKEYKFIPEDKSFTLTRTKEFHFDENKRLAKQLEYTKDDRAKSKKSSRKTEYTFKDDFLVSKLVSTQGRKAGRYKKTTYEWNNTPNKKTVVINTDSWVPFYKRIQVFDESNRLTEQLLHYKNDTLKEHSTYVYDKKGDAEKTTKIYDKDGKLKEKVVSIQDDGKYILHQTFDPEENEMLTTISLYHKNGWLDENVIAYKEERRKINDMELKYVYDDKPNWETKIQQVTFHGREDGRKGPYYTIFVRKFSNNDDGMEEINEPDLKIIQSLLKKLN